MKKIIGVCTYSIDEVEIEFDDGSVEYFDMSPVADPSDGSDDCYCLDWDAVPKAYHDAINKSLDADGKSAAEDAYSDRVTRGQEGGYFGC